MIAGSAGFHPHRAFRSTYFSQPAVDLGTLDPTNLSLSNEARGVNDSEYVVGWSESSIGVTKTFVHDSVSMIDLNTRLVNPGGWDLDSANAINEAGEIVGSGLYNGQGSRFYFFLRFRATYLRSGAKRAILSSSLAGLNTLCRRPRTK